MKFIRIPSNLLRVGKYDSYFSGPISIRAMESALGARVVDLPDYTSGDAICYVIGDSKVYLGTFIGYSNRGLVVETKIGSLLVVAPEDVRPFEEEDEGVAEEVVDDPATEPLNPSQTCSE